MASQGFYFGSMFWAILGIAALLITATIPFILKFIFGIAAGLFVFFVFVGKRRYRAQYVINDIHPRSHRTDGFV